MMLVRIGDEKREMLDAHVNVLKTVICKTEDHLVDTRDELLSTLTKVILNLPHKLRIYAGLVYLINQEKSDLAEQLCTALLPALIAESFNKHDAFASRNVSTWLGYLLKFGLVSQAAADQFK